MKSPEKEKLINTLEEIRLDEEFFQKCFGHKRLLSEVDTDYEIFLDIKNHFIQEGIKQGKAQAYKEVLKEIKADSEWGNKIGFQLWLKRRMEGDYSP